jgi:hypothetical protein
MLSRSTLFLVSFQAVVLLLTGCGGGSSGGESSTSVDRTPPVITVTGSTTVNHEQGTTYSDQGATATDAVDGAVSVSTSGSVGAAAGTYTLTYTATDSAGNSATATRTVIVADTTAPEITLTGAASITIEEGTPFTEPGVSAMDTVDGSVAVTTTGSVGSAVGTYELTYTATDAAGNVATATRTVIVEASPPGPDQTDLLVFVDGAVDPTWDRGLNAFDQAIGFGECNNDGGAGCPSISWGIVADNERGNVLEIAHSAAGNLAGVFIASNTPLDVSGFANGSVVFDIRVVSGDSNITMKLDCVFPCTSGDQNIGSRGETGWETVEIPFTTLTTGGLDLTNVNTGIVIWATRTLIRESLSGRQMPRARFSESIMFALPVSMAAVRRLSAITRSPPSVRAAFPTRSTRPAIAVSSILATGSTMRVLWSPPLTPATSQLAFRQARRRLDTRN